MSLNTVVGYPRIGSQRELKFFTEDYFQGRISESELKEKARKLRASQWLMLKNKGVDLIPCGDFSFYDGMLDTACMLGAVPKAYKVLGLSELDTYFAMARGYQGAAGDVKALAMRKWFNTNYHYMVPVLEDGAKLELSESSLFNMCSEALSLGINAKPVMIGPFTFLKLAEGKAKNHVEAVIKVYADIIARLDSLGVQWIQIDEPSLVMDLSKEDVALFTTLYEAILLSKNKTKLLLQTYFGDIRDVYKSIMALDFDGIGLDFAEGKQTLSLIKEYGFRDNQTLFAGVVNGRNVWRNNYAKTLALLNTLTSHINKNKIVISTSCSLLHVPYSLDNEMTMDGQYKRCFAFAQEKLDELCDLTQLFEDHNCASNEIYISNTLLMSAKEQFGDEAVRKRVLALEEKDFIRSPEFSQREKLQKKTLCLPDLPTTTIGSFPQTADIKALRSACKKRTLNNEEYNQRIKEAIAECIAMQEDIDLDVLVHGEFERNDMVEYFGENLEGFLFTQKAWVQSYGTRCVKPPIVWGDIKWTKPITVGYIAYAQSLTKRPVKGMLTGPVTILNWSFPREDIPPRETAFQIALAIREEVLALEKAGIRIIQIDEAALKEKLPLRRADWHCDYLDWAIAAFRLVHASVLPATQIHTHMCYSEFDDIITDIDNMDADVITFEASRSNLSIVKTLQQVHFRTAVGPGVYDIHSPRVPSIEEIKQAVEIMLNMIPKEKLWINPDCGLKTRGNKETLLSLKNLVTAAKKVRETLTT